MPEDVVGVGVREPRAPASTTAAGETATART